MTDAEVAPGTPTPRPRSPLRQVVLASLIGTTIEWYDFFLYGTAAALVFGKLFFPDKDPLTGLLQAFLTYSLGFVARPIGGLVFGHFGDRIGRKRLLMASLVLMGAASMAMGLLPTYQQIGVAAPRAAGGPAVRARLRGRRRMGRRGADGRRVRRRCAPRRLVRLAAGRRAGRQPARRRRAGGDGGGPERGGLPGLGLARGVPALRPLGRRRLVGALDLERVAAVRGGPVRGGDCAGGACCRACAGDPGAEASAGRRRGRRRPEVRRERRLLHRHHLRDRLPGRDRARQAADRRSTRC